MIWCARGSAATSRATSAGTSTGERGRGRGPLWGWDATLARALGMSRGGRGWGRGRGSRPHVRSARLECESGWVPGMVLDAAGGGDGAGVRLPRRPLRRAAGGAEVVEARGGGDGGGGGARAGACDTAAALQARAACRGRRIRVRPRDGGGRVGAPPASGRAAQR
jgi:hypothetical protein